MCKGCCEDEWGFDRKNALYDIPFVVNSIYMEDIMKLKEIHLKQFKRFSELNIINIPSSSKLVVLVGPNGCG